MNIIEKDISWLIKSVPDFPHFFDNGSGYKHLFDNGYIAGGFLRKVILNASAQTALMDLQNLKKGDIDFFYYTQKDCEKAVDKFLALGGQLDNVYGKLAPRPCVPNSFGGFAYEGMLYGVKHQFIFKNVGCPTTVLNRFDISNCKIATDGKKVWMVEDWEKIETEKNIRIDNYSGDFLLRRIEKYLTKEYSVNEETKTELLYKMLEKCKAGNDYIIIRRLLKKQNFIPKEMILMFYDKAGLISEAPEGEEYSNGSLAKPVDFALHMYKQRSEKEL
jgi:hypothetical protein